MLNAGYFVSSPVPKLNEDGVENYTLANTTKYSSKKIFEKRPLCKLTSQAN
jgi:hypothetical protein